MSSTGFVPSAESLSIFDDIKRGVDAQRRSALESLRAIKCNDFSDVTECRDSVRGRQTHAQSTGISWRLPHEVVDESHRTADGSRATPNAFEQNGKDPVNWVLDSRYDAPTKAGNERQDRLGREVLVSKSNKPYHTDTDTSPESKEWVQRLKRAHREMTVGPSPDVDLWSRDHIPYQLQSSRPSPVSGASNGWELNDELVRQMRERVTRIPEEQEEFGSCLKFLAWKNLVSTVSTWKLKMLSVLGSVQNAMGIFGKLVRNVMQWF
ncbi:hypothetical protein FGB62_42g38 [Gracilaria domingensis]|nr:hypothetical protein FGB62_42g38 [Gracilaria domingensis]